MNYLQVGRLVVVATVNDRGWPDTAPISWITALDRRTLRMAVSREVSTYRNILYNERVTLSLIGGAMTLGIRGRARVLADDMEQIPLPMAMVEVLIDEVKDDSFIGRGAEGELIKWEDRRRMVSDISVHNALRNTTFEPEFVMPMPDQPMPQFQG